jgi:hypothetical protein
MFTQALPKGSRYDLPCLPQNLLSGFEVLVFDKLEVVLTKQFL